MYQTKRTLEDIKTHGYELDFSTVFNKSLDNYKKTALLSGVGMLLVMLLIGAFVGIIVFAIIGITLIKEPGNNPMDPKNLDMLGLAIYWFSLTIFSTIFYPLTAGFIKMSQDAFKDKNLSLGTIFSCYFNNKTGALLMAGAAISGTTNLLNTALSFVGWNMLGFMVSLFVSVITILTIPLIIFEDKQAIEAIEASIQISSKQFLIVLGLMLVSAIFSVLGLFGLCIGIVFTLPFIYSFQYILYTEIIGDPEELEEITSNDFVQENQDL